MHVILVRLVKVRGFWALLLPASVIVALSGIFEIIEAIVERLVSPELSAAYLGIQGDVWDGQKDMVQAILGATLLATLMALRSKRHDTGPGGIRVPCPVNPPFTVVK